MNVLSLLLLAGAVFCFTLATLGVGGRVNLVALGLALWALEGLLPVLGRLD